MSINNILSNFAQQKLVLGRTSAEREHIDNSLNHLQVVLKNKLSNEIKNFLIFGSYTRNTILPRQYDSCSDVDLMVVFNGTLSPETYRTKIRDVIESAYPNSISKKDFPAVKLELNHIQFDLVPAYYSEDWLGYSHCHIPDKKNSWQETTPNDINKPLQEKNQSCGNNIIRNTIRLCKHWNANAERPFESYLMEKQIINLSYWNANDTYSRFYNVMKNIACDIPSVKQALDNILMYNQRQDEYKQLLWLKKLLPGLE